MIVKKVSVEIAQGRSVATFFKRNLENFDRKFDGFPAIQLSPAATPAMQEDPGTYDIDEQAIIDQIAATGGWATQGSTPPCPDRTAEECSGIPESGTNEPCGPCPSHYSDTFDRTAVSPGWGTASDCVPWVMQTPANAYTTGASGVMDLAANGGTHIIGASRSLAGCTTTGDGYPFRISGWFQVDKNESDWAAYGGGMDAVSAELIGFTVYAASSNNNLHASINVTGVDTSNTQRRLQYVIQDGTGATYGIASGAASHVNLARNVWHRIDIEFAETGCSISVDNGTPWVRGAVPSARSAPTSVRVGNSISNISLGPKPKLQLDWVDFKDVGCGDCDSVEPSNSTLISDMHLQTYDYSHITHRHNENLGGNCFVQTQNFSNTSPSTVNQTGYNDAICGPARQREWVSIPPKRTIGSNEVARWARINAGGDATTNGVSVYFKDTATNARPLSTDLPDTVVSTGDIFAIPTGMTAWCQPGEGPIPLGANPRLQWSYSSPIEAYADIWYTADANASWGTPGTPGMDCSGETIVDTLTWDGTKYVSSNLSKSFVDVWYDDLMAVKDVDYTEDGGVVPTSTLTEGTVVKARYIVL